MPDIVHICYPGVGGQAAVATGLAVEGMAAGVSQGVIFYGVEQTAAQYLALCAAHGIEHRSILKEPGVALSARRALRKDIIAMAPRMIVSHHHDTAITVAGSRAMHSSGRKSAQVFVEHHSNALKSRKDWLLSTLAHRLSDHTVYLTETYRQEVLSRVGGWISAGKTSVIANGLDLSHYQPSAPNHTVIGMQGRMDVGKDFESLLRAFACLDHAKSPVVLDLVGDGPDRVRLKKLTASLGLSDRVSFTGFLSHQALVERMGGWSVSVLMTMGETLSMAVLESWALSLPLISTRVSGMQELVGHEADGILVPASDVSSLTKALEAVLADPVMSRRLGEAGRMRVQKDFDRKKIWQQYLTLADRLCPEEISLRHPTLRQIPIN